MSVHMELALGHLREVGFVTSLLPSSCSYQAQLAWSEAAGPGN